jgi:hypothetical protein
VQFYVLPAKLKRKRHKDREQNAIYCRNCYEQHSELPYLIDGEHSSAPVVPREATDQMTCRICGLPSATSRERDELYALLTSSLWMDLSIVASYSIAFFCAQCVESHKISLLSKI